MISVDSSPPDHIEMTVAAPFTTDDLIHLGTSLRALTHDPRLRRALVVVESITLPMPRAMWEDLKLTPLIRYFRRAALVTGIDWYAHLSELAGDLTPHLSIKHFQPGDLDAAREWLATRPQP